MTACESLNPRQLHYNENNLPNVARNTFIVKDITSHTFDTMKNQDIVFIWEFVMEFTGAAKIFGTD